MSTALRELSDLLDDVEAVPGWRVEKLNGTRWRIYPPKPAGIIHISASEETRGLKNARALLRRAGFRDREDTKLQAKIMPRTAVGDPALSPAAVPVSVSPMDQIRGDVDCMLGCLTRISDNLKAIDKEREGIQQLKTLLGTVLK